MKNKPTSFIDASTGREIGRIEALDILAKIRAGLPRCPYCKDHRCAIYRIALVNGETIDRPEAQARHLMSAMRMQVEKHEDGLLMFAGV